MTPKRKAFTLVELLAVCLILGLLATVAVGVYTNQVERARIAAARQTISELEMAANRYQVDVGTYPPSGSGTLPFASNAPAVGCGYLELALIHSMSGNSQSPNTPLWKGPYISIQNQYLGDSNGNNFAMNPLLPGLTPGQVQIIDPWGKPYRYVRYGPSPDDYATMGGTKLPTGHPFAATEVYYNPNTFQIVSDGNDGVTPAPPNVGTDSDDVTNFGL